MYFISWEKSKSFHRKVNSIQISIKLRQTLRQITQKQCTAQAWELERWLKDIFPTTFQVLGLFHWTISSSFFVAWKWSLKWRSYCASQFLHWCIRLWPQIRSNNRYVPYVSWRKCVVLPIGALPCYVYQVKMAEKQEYLWPFFVRAIGRRTVSVLDGFVAFEFLRCR